MGETDRRIKLRYPGVCRICGVDLPVRVEAIYDWSTRTVRCVACPASGTQTGVASSHSAGIAGASARRSYERRKATDEQRLRRKWGHFGGIAVALADERPSTRAWATGAIGEERLGRRLNSLVSETVCVLHDRRIPRSSANIDHIVVTRGGIWVIDAKRYKGRPRLRVEGGILRPRVERLVVGRRDCSRLVAGVLKQAELVRQRVGDVPVTGVLCFVEADWPLLGGAFKVADVHVLWPKRLVKLLAAADGPADGPVDVLAVGNALASYFKTA